MINRFIAYNIAELEKHSVLSYARMLFKSSVIDENQSQQIATEFASKLFSPTTIMRILLFILTYFCISSFLTLSGFFLYEVFDVAGMGALQIVSLIFGSGLIWGVEYIFIRESNHYKSGVIEAGLYTGLGFIAFGLLGVDNDNMIVFPIVGFVLTAIAAVRYLDNFCLILAHLFLGWMIFQLSYTMGGIFQLLIPFVMMLSFALLYFGAIRLEQKLNHFIFENQFIISKTISLLIVYLAGNYFVVRELSINMMGLELTDSQDIPFAWLFYFFTAIIPIVYLVWGVRQKSILFIRVSLLVLALSVITLKYYFSMGYPVVTITISGALLIAVALILFNYLKKNPNGFTREKLLSDKWSNPDLTAFIASQTLGGNAVANSPENTSFDGGKFGGAGAGQSF